MIISLTIFSLILACIRDFFHDVYIPLLGKILIIRENFVKFFPTSQDLFPNRKNFAEVFPNIQEIFPSRKNFLIGNISLSEKFWPGFP